MPITSLDPEEILKSMKAAACVEQKLSEDAWLRRYQYTPGWSEDVKMARFDNGSGDFVVVLRGRFGCVVIGFDHESPVSPHAQDEHGLWPGLIDGLPDGILALAKDPSIGIEEGATFIHWNLGNGWCRGPVEFQNNENDGSGWLLRMIEFRKDEFIESANAYWEEVFENIDKTEVDACFS